MRTCGFVPPTPGYAPCTREEGHVGPCAHPFAAGDVNAHWDIPDQAPPAELDWTAIVAWCGLILAALVAVALSLWLGVSK